MLFICLRFKEPNCDPLRDGLVSLELASDLGMPVVFLGTAPV